MRYARLLVRALVVTAAVLPPAARSAPVLCTEPLKPICVGQDTTYQSRDTTARCRSDLEQYGHDVQDYVKCLRKAIRVDRKTLANEREKFRKKGKKARARDQAGGSTQPHAH